MKKLLIVAVLVVYSAIIFALGIGYSWDHAEHLVVWEIEQAVKEGKAFFIKGSDIKIIPRNSSKANASIERSFSGSSAEGFVQTFEGVSK